MKRVALVTGASSGIGFALCTSLLTSTTDISVVAVCREPSSLEGLSRQFLKRLTIVNSDIATESGRNHLCNVLGNIVKIDFVVHCAAVVTPLAPLENIDYHDWMICQQTNVDAPVFITLKLLKKLSHSRVLFLTSDATLQPVYGAASYCVSKMALHMAYACLKTEIAVEKAIFGLVAPGNVDTPMQERIRMTDPNYLPIATAMTDAYEKNRLLTPELAATYISKILLTANSEEFSSRCWNISEYLKRP